MYRRKLHYLFIVLLLTGCKQVYNEPVETAEFLHDDLFPNYLSEPIETEAEVFAINDAMRDFVDREVMTENKPWQQINALTDGIFDRSGTMLLYQNDANTTAIETFANQTANCLSLTIMSYALAEYAGFKVDFQQVRTPELWIIREGTSILNRHINLRVSQRTEPNVYIFGAKDYIVDFNMQQGNKRHPKSVISKQRVLSMFYNNKGVDALIDKDYQRAYAYFKKGIKTDAYMVDNYTNLGLLYRLMGRNDYAENNYTIALKLEPNDGTTLENLAVLYRMTGRVHEADKIQRDLKKKRLSNPYYHYLLGEQALEDSDLLAARKHFRSAINLLSGNHEFYFAMARTLHLLGDKDGTQRFLYLAKKHSDSEPDQQLRYQQKLNSYSKLQ